MTSKIETYLILKYGKDLDYLLYKWALSDNDFLSLDEKQVLIDHCNGRFNVTDFKSLKDLREHTLRAKYSHSG